MRKSKVKIVVRAKYYKDKTKFEDYWIAGNISTIVREITNINYTKKCNNYITIEKIKPKGYYSDVLGTFTIVLGSTELCKMVLKQTVLSIFSMPPLSSHFDLVELK